MQTDSLCLNALVLKTIKLQQIFWWEIDLWKMITVFLSALSQDFSRIYRTSFGSSFLAICSHRTLVVILTSTGCPFLWTVVRTELRMVYVQFLLKVDASGKSASKLSAWNVLSMQRVQIPAAIVAMLVQKYTLFSSLIAGQTEFECLFS